MQSRKGKVREECFVDLSLYVNTNSILGDGGTRDKREHKKGHQTTRQTKLGTTL
jgi:hypothetical protein